MDMYAWMRKSAVLAIIVLASIFVMAPSAQAEAVPVQTYWAYASGAANVTGWKWSNTGWTQASFIGGTSFWTAPFASGWRWAYRNNAWYAIRQDSLTVWSCYAPGTGMTLRTTYKTKVYKYNNINSPVVAELPASNTIGATTVFSGFVCENNFTDATYFPSTLPVMPTQFMLVYYKSGGFGDCPAGCIGWTSTGKGYVALGYGTQVEHLGAPTS